MSETPIAVGTSAAGNATRAAGHIPFADPATRPQTREQIRVRIEKTGIIPTIRVASAEHAFFAAEAVAGAGIPVVEISTTSPGAKGILSQLVRHAPEMIVGGGSISSLNAARQCLDQGAKFLTSYGLLPDVVEFVAKENAVFIPGALTPTEIIAARNAGADFVKVYPCDLVGGHKYIRSLKVALPEARLIAAGGVSQLTARELIAAGASALCLGEELFPEEAIWLREGRRVQELARRFLSFVNEGRARNHR